MRRRGAAARRASRSVVRKLGRWRRGDVSSFDGLQRGVGQPLPAAALRGLAGAVELVGGRHHGVGSERVDQVGAAQLLCGLGPDPGEIEAPAALGEPGGVVAQQGEQGAVQGAAPAQAQHHHGAARAGAAGGRHAFTLGAAAKKRLP